MTVSSFDQRLKEHRVDLPFNLRQPAHGRSAAGERFRSVREWTRRLCEPLEPADYELQSMADASPVKWHLAHTSWFFEEFVLRPNDVRFRPYHPQFGFLFNSYYNAVGDRHPRRERGLLSRPSLAEVLAYRRSVDERVLQLFDEHCDARDVLSLIELGCHHEQQHQELILTDLKHLFSRNPLLPAYRSGIGSPFAEAEVLRFVPLDGGLVEVGAHERGFAFDNERPRHRTFLQPFAIANRLVTNAEFAEFIADGGYQRPELWLDQGFQHAQGHGWDKPLYWRGRAGTFREFTLAGEREWAANEPVSHVSLYEADAYARWAGARLCRELEWEHAATDLEMAGNFADRGRFHPEPARAERHAGDRALRQCFGDAWEWTQSPYVAYPGYQPAAGAVGEYNGKFMCNQFVLRGGSCATPHDHMRVSYRNFFYAKDRWQFTGIRLARDLF